MASFPFPFPPARQSKSHLRLSLTSDTDSYACFALLCSSIPTVSFKRRSSPFNSNPD
uniref:Uncharacterized protein n=1 Tax=Arundo donax TaxID=35708 RepID=A0A0A9CQX7_ARUDO